MPLVKGTRSRLFTGSTSPKPPYITDSEKLHDALLKSQHEVLKMREQMEFLAFLVRRAWQGDRNAMADVASIVGINNNAHGNLLQFTGGQETSESEKWATMVENMLRQERERDEEQSSTVKLVEREVMLEGQMQNHAPVFSSYLNKPRGNYKTKLRAKSAGPVRTTVHITRKSNSSLMSETPSAPASSPRPGSAPRPSSAMRPVSAPVSKKSGGARTDNVSVHGSEVLIAHTPSYKFGRSVRCAHTDRCTCPIVRAQHEGPWQYKERLGVPTSATLWHDQGNIKFGDQLLQEKVQMMVAILCAAGK